jgi:hypothetical protein
VVTQQSASAECKTDSPAEATALAQEAYKHIRAREYDAARPIIERGLALYPDDLPLAHMKAHLCIDSGAFEDGAAYLRPFLATHDPFKGVNVHTAWHLAYIELELDRPEAALDWHRRVVAPTLSEQTFYSAVSLIWRLELRGHGDKALQPDWQTLRTAALGLTRQGNLQDLARAMTFVATGDGDNLTRLRKRIAATDDPTATDVVLPFVGALHAYWHGDFATTVRLLEPLVPSLSRLSEFTDQLTVFHDTLTTARTRSAGLR